MSVSVYSSALQLPRGNSKQRPSPPAAGMLYFNTDKDDVEKYDPIVGGWVNLTMKAYRYWRYVEGSAVILHHPRVSRIMLHSEGGQVTTIVTYAGDNCSDSGAYQIGTVTYDFGANAPQRIIGVSVYSSYGGGARASNYTVQYSSDNSNWNNYFTGISHNCNNFQQATQAPSCGIFKSVGGFNA